MGTKMLINLRIEFKNKKDFTERSKEFIECFDEFCVNSMYIYENKKVDRKGVV